MTKPQRDVFLTFMVVHLADVKARLEVMLRTQAILAAKLSGEPLDTWLDKMKGELVEARKLHEAGMLQDVETIAEERQWPPASDSQN